MRLPKDLHPNLQKGHSWMLHMDNPDIETTNLIYVPKRAGFYPTFDRRFMIRKIGHSWEITVPGMRKDMNMLFASETLEKMQAEYNWLHERNLDIKFQSLYAALTALNEAYS